MLGINHPSATRALVRLEDVGALVSVNTAMKTLTDYLSAEHVPFSVAVIPRYVDPLGVYNGGVPQEGNRCRRPPTCGSRWTMRSPAAPRW